MKSERIGPNRLPAWTGTKSLPSKCSKRGSANFSKRRPRTKAISGLLRTGQNSGSISEMLLKIKNGFFARIDERLARLAIIEKHYLHRPCPISWAWGVVVDEKLKGVLTVGRPCSRTVCEGVCGKERSADVFELNRLWLDESLPCNSESQFIGWCLRELRKTNRNAILVSRPVCSLPKSLSETQHG